MQTSISKWVMFSIFLYFLIPPTVLRAASTGKEEFAIFDGRSYNSKFYPRIDIIEWGEPISHMEFHVYYKGHPVKMAFQLEKKDGKKVMLVNYWLKDRNEHVCRRVVVPSHFDDNFSVYTDSSDKDFDNTLVAMDKLPIKGGVQLVMDQAPYVGCAEDESERQVASKEKANPSSGAVTPVAEEEDDEEDAPPPPPKVKKKHLGTTINSKNGSAAFSDW